MKWLLTGGAGFIGANLACDLVAAGETCLVTDNFHQAGAKLNSTFLRENCRLQVTELDVRFADRVDAFFAAHPDIGVIAHLAGQVSLLASVADPRYDFETNALGTFNMLEAARRYTPRAKIIFAGTNKVYGDLAAVRCEETASRYTVPDYPRGFPETLPVDSCGGYSCSKSAADQYVRDYRRTFGLKTVSLRQSSVYGGHQYATEDQGWVAYFVEMGLRERPFRISGTGKQVRDLLHVSDLCRLFRLIAELPNGSPAWGEAFNIGGGMERTLSLVELFERLRCDFGFTLEYTAGPPRAGDQKVFIADGAKALQLLGWAPETSLAAGLEETIAWSRSRLGRDR